MLLLEANLGPYSLAHRVVNDSVASRTRSSSPSAESTAINLLDCALSAASTYSASNRLKRSRCSTSMIFWGSLNSDRNARLCPLRTEPTSVATRSSEYPCSVAKAHTLPICLSRSDFWPDDEARASINPRSMLRLFRFQISDQNEQANLTR